MITSLSYFAAEVMAVTALLIVGLSVIISNPRNNIARIFSLICLSNICFLIIRMGHKSTPEFEVSLGLFTIPVHIILNTGAGLWMMLCYSLFQDLKKLPRWLLVAFAIQMSLSAIRPLYVSIRLSEIDISSIGEMNYFIFGTLPLILQSMFILGALYWVIKGWRVDLLESRRILRWIVLGAISTLYFTVIVANLIMMTASVERQIIVNNVITFGAAFFNIAMAVVVLRFDATVIEKTVRAINPIKSNELDVELEKFYRIFRDKKSYLEPGFSIANLASKMSVPQYKLRSLINSKLGYRNFNALLNEYRISEACDQLSNEEMDHLPILTIALSVGYQSIAPFNKAFREMKDVTPSLFRQNSRMTPGTNENKAT